MKAEPQEMWNMVSLASRPHTNPNRDGSVPAKPADNLRSLLSGVCATGPELLQWSDTDDVFLYVAVTVGGALRTAYILQTCKSEARV